MAIFPLSLFILLSLAKQCSWFFLFLTLYSLLRVSSDVGMDYQMYTDLHIPLKLLLCSPRQGGIYYIYIYIYMYVIHITHTTCNTYYTYIYLSVCVCVCVYICMYTCIYIYIYIYICFYFSVSNSCPNLCNPMDCSTLGYPVVPNLLEFALPLCVCVCVCVCVRKWQPTPVFLPGESHGQRSLAGYSPEGLKRWTQLIK